MPRRVVIADDTAFFRVALRDILSSGGFEVIGEAADGEEAFYLTKNNRPEIVILDIVMPEKDGLKAAEEIARLKLGTKIVMCSSMGYENVVKKALQSGACAFIVKPFDKNTILKTLYELDTDET
jgi:two-component system chemotaxis response regulator CheY